LRAATRSHAELDRELRWNYDRWNLEEARRDLLIWLQVRQEVVSLGEEAVEQQVM